MIGQAIEIPSDAMLTERTASTRHRKEIYVFPVHHDVNQTHIAKLVFRTFLVFWYLFKFVYFFVRFNLDENEWINMDLPKPIKDRYGFIL